MTIQALYIPADFDQKPVLVELEDRSQIRALVDGTPEQGRYDRDAIVWGHETGRKDGQPYNLGASDYIEQYSEAAEQYWERNNRAPDIRLHGDIVITGNSSTLPQRIVNDWPNAEKLSLHDLMNRVDEERRVQSNQKHGEDYGYGF